MTNLSLTHQNDNHCTLHMFLFYAIDKCNNASISIHHLCQLHSPYTGISSFTSNTSSQWAFLSACDLPQPGQQQTLTDRFWQYFTWQGHHKRCIISNSWRKITRVQNTVSKTLFHSQILGIHCNILLAPSGNCCIKLCIISHVCLTPCILRMVAWSNHM